MSPPPPQGYPNTSRRPGALWRFVTRTTLLVVWIFVLWGTLLFASALVDLVREGFPALRRLDPHAQPGPLPWINAGLAILAPAVWVLVVTAIVLARRKSVPR